MRYPAPLSRAQTTHRLWYPSRNREQAPARRKMHAGRRPHRLSDPHRSEKRSHRRVLPRPVPSDSLPQTRSNPCCRRRSAYTLRPAPLKRHCPDRHPKTSPTAFRPASALLSVLPSLPSMLLRSPAALPSAIPASARPAGPLRTVPPAALPPVRPMPSRIQTAKEAGPHKVPLPRF